MHRERDKEKREEKRDMMFYVVCKHIKSMREIIGKTRM